MSFRMTATDWAILDAAEARIARAEWGGFDPDPEDEEIVDYYKGV